MFYIETYAKKNCTNVLIYSISKTYDFCFHLFVYSKYTYWQFKNGKVGPYSPKIDKDTIKINTSNFIKLSSITQIANKWLNITS